MTAHVCSEFCVSVSDTHGNDLGTYHFDTTGSYLGVTTEESVS
jgi:hypothetical protein